MIRGASESNFLLAYYTEVSLYIYQLQKTCCISLVTVVAIVRSLLCFVCIAMLLSSSAHFVVTIQTGRHGEYRGALFKSSLHTAEVSC